MHASPSTKGTRARPTHAISQAAKLASRTKKPRQAVPFMASPTTGVPEGG